MMSTTTHSSHPLIGEVYMVKFDGAGSVQRKYRQRWSSRTMLGTDTAPTL